MNDPRTRTLDEWFEYLVDLAEAEREAALGQAPTALRARLVALLAADASAEDPLARAVAAVALPAAAEGGTRLGAWRVVRELGAGGMGTVFLAARDDGQYEARAAIKLLRGFPTAEGIRRLRQERQILAGLDHPGIARLLDGGETADGQPFVVMEYIEGLTLLQHVAAGAPPLGDRLTLIDRIAEALEYAHRNLVIHRDLKPSNVLVRADGTPKVLDFGVAKLLDVDRESNPEQTATMVFSPGYASPEQRAGRVVTTASDVYGLGVMLREMLQGPPRREPGDDAFPALLPDAELRGLIAMATAEDPAQRYRSVEALREDLRRYRENRPLRASPDTVLYRARKFLRRNRWQTGLAIAALAGVAAFVWRLGVERERAIAAGLQAQASQAAAERAANSTRRTLDYVVTIFGHANPEKVLGRDMTPRMLVDEAARELDVRLAGEPAARRAMQAVLGQVYLSLGAAGDALAMLDEAVRDVEPGTREEALWLADTQSERSAAAQDSDDYVAASAAARIAAGLRDRWAPDDPLQKLRSLNEQARAAMLDGDHDAARHLWSRSIAAARDTANVAPELVEDQLLQLSGVASGMGAFESADAAAVELLQRLHARLPEQHPAFLPAYRMRAFCLSILGRHAEAEQLFERALALHRKVIGNSGMMLSDLENDFGAALLTAGRFRGAVSHMQASVGLMAEALGGEDRVDGVVLSNFGSAQEAIGDYPAALRTMRTAAERLEQRRSPKDMELLKVRGSLARTLALAGDVDAGRTLMHQALRDLAEVEGEDGLWLAFNRVRLAHIERLGGNREAAFALLAQALPRFEALLPPGHQMIAQTLRLRGRLALETGDLARAAADLEAARRMLTDGGALPIDLAMLDVSRAALARAEGRPEQARRMLEPALALLRAELLPQEVMRAEAERLDAALRERPARS